MLKAFTKSSSLILLTKFLLLDRSPSVCCHNCDLRNAKASLFLALTAGQTCVLFSFPGRRDTGLLSDELVDCNPCEALYASDRDTAWSEPVCRSRRTFLGWKAGFILIGCVIACDRNGIEFELSLDAFPDVMIWWSVNKEGKWWKYLHRHPRWGLQGLIENDHAIPLSQDKRGQ